MPELYIGLMSGTRLDGVDAVIADLDGGSIRLLHSHYQPFQPQLRDALLALHDEGRDELHGRSHPRQPAGSYLRPSRAG